MSDKERLVHVSYRRQVSDGNYGTESAEAYLEWYIGADEDDPHLDYEIAQEMLGQAHNIVHAQLGNSRSATVRRVVEPRTTAPPKTAATLSDDIEPLPF